MRRKLTVVAVTVAAALAAGCHQMSAGHEAAPGRGRDAPLKAVARETYDQSRPRSIAPAANAEDTPGDMTFRDHGVNPETDTARDSASTFAVDVDTGSYTVCRAYLERGQLPPPAAVRVEEFVNALPYDYASLCRDEHGPLSLLAEGGPSLFGRSRTLLRVALAAREVSRSDRAPANLVLVIDTSGSMGMENRLGLVQRAVGLLLKELSNRDTVGIVAYGSEARTVLEAVPAGQRRRIEKAVAALAPGGSTNAEAGLRLGYEMAERSAREYGPRRTQRVILLSDGVANVGRTGPEEILDTIAGGVSRGITLTAVGVGMGNYNDRLLEQLADHGNGRYVYIDTEDEARRLFVHQVAGTLELAARDVRTQVVFNDDAVRSWRLIGYENRQMADEAFRSASADGGEVGAGHQATALYELVLRDGLSPTSLLATVTVRYTPDTGAGPVEMQRAVELRQVARRFDDASRSFRLAACAAEFAEILRGSPSATEGSLGELERETRRLDRGWGRDKPVEELVRLIRTAARLGAESRQAHRG